MNDKAKEVSTAAGKVDVLAVLDKAALRIEQYAHKAKGPASESARLALARQMDQAIAAVAELIAYAECEEAKRLSLLPASKGGTGNGQSYLETFRRHGFEGRDVYGFMDKLRRNALARVGAAG